MNRILYALLRRSSITRHWLSRHVTGSGFLFLAALFFSAAIGVDTRQNTVFHFFTILLSLGFVALCCCLFFKVSVKVVRRLPESVTAGETFRYRINVENQGKKFLRLVQIFDNMKRQYPTFAEFNNSSDPPAKGFQPFAKIYRWQQLLSSGIMARTEILQLDTLAPQSSGEIWLQCTPQRRGILRFTSIVFARTDPFGLFRSLVSTDCRNTLVVLPKRYPLPPLQLCGTRKYQPSGVALASSVGDSQEFMSMRDYRPGDPPRTIHWRSWAKTGKPMVKEYQDEYFSRHGLILDTFSRHGADRCFEEAVSVAASLACTVAGRDSLLDLLFIGNRAYCFTAGRSLGHSQQLLEILASVQPAPAGSFRQLSELIHRQAELLSSCICVLLAWDQQRQDFITGIAARGIPVLTLIISDKDDIIANQDIDAAIPIHHLHPERMAEGLARL